MPGQAHYADVFGDAFLLLLQQAKHTEALRVNRGDDGVELWILKEQLLRFTITVLKGVTDKGRGNRQLRQAKLLDSTLITGIAVPEGSDHSRSLHSLPQYC